RRIRAGRLADRRLVDEHDVRELLGADDRVVRAGRIARAAGELHEPLVEHVLDERRLPGAADAGHADEPAERNPDVDPLQVVLGRAADLEPTLGRPGVANRGRLERFADPLLAAEVLRRQRRAARDELGRAAVEHDPPAFADWARPHVDCPVGRDPALRYYLQDGLPSPPRWD